MYTPFYRSSCGFRLRFRLPSGIPTSLRSDRLLAALAPLLVVFFFEPGGTLFLSGNENHQKKKTSCEASS